MSRFDVPRPGDKPMLPPTYAILALLAMVVVHYLAPVARLADPPVTWLGVPFIVVGLIFNVWAGGLFTRRRTPFNPFAEPRRLVREGPFALSRNPMYLGIVLIAIGAAMLMGTLSPFFFIVVLAWILQTRFIAIEEAQMEDAFGDAFREYRRKVRRWV